MEHVKKYWSIISGLAIAITNYLFKVFPLPAINTENSFFHFDKLLDTVIIIILIILGLLWKKRDQFKYWLIAFIIMAGAAIIPTYKFHVLKKECVRIIYDSTYVTGGQNFTKYFIDDWLKSPNHKSNPDPIDVILGGYLSRAWDSELIASNTEKIIAYHFWAQCFWLICILCGLQCLYCLRAQTNPRHNIQDH